MITIQRLHLASLRGVDGREWPVHGFVVTHPGGALLVDTGVGGPGHVLDSWRVVNRSVADALAALDMSPADIDLVVNTHLHFDHCGQNAVFKHAPCYVQRAELARCKDESSELYEWFSFASARWELLDGDTEIVPGVSVMATPGHTVGHQCVVVRDSAGSSGADLLIGDAAYTPGAWVKPERGVEVRGQATDPVAWHESLGRLRSLAASRVHFCHHTDVLHGLCCSCEDHCRGRVVRPDSRGRTGLCNASVECRPERGHLLDSRGRRGRPGPAHRGRGVHRHVRARHAGGTRCVGGGRAGVGDLRAGWRAAHVHVDHRGPDAACVLRAALRRAGRF